jgi:hypothetical protein
MGPSAFCSQSRLIFSDARSERRGFICTEGVPDLQKVMYPLSPTADPDGTAWISIASSPELGNEIGDICHGISNSSVDEVVPTFLINGKKYEAQLEYSNTYHACASTP